MKMKLSKTEAAAFLGAGEPRKAPDYSAELAALRQTLTREQDERLMSLLEAFGALARYERRWYFHMGYSAGKKQTP